MNWNALEEVCKAVQAAPAASDWYHCQTVIGAHELHGERYAAYVLGAVKPERRGAVKDLCYVMYRACERKRLPREAHAYQALIGSWPQIVALIPESLR